MIEKEALRTLREALKHEQAVARGRIMSIKKDAYNVNLISANKRDLFARSSYVHLDKSLLNLKKFNAIKDESKKKAKMEDALEALKKSNEAPRGKVSYIKERVGVNGQKDAKSFFDKLVSGDVKDMMHKQLNYIDSDDAMDFIVEHKEGDVEVTEERARAVFGDDVFGGI